MYGEKLKQNKHIKTIKMKDTEFDKLPLLAWYPWIGNEYLQVDAENKLLIIGESHYSGDTQESIDKHKQKSYTRTVIKEMAIGRNYYNTRIFPNLHKALFKNDKFDSSSFWNKVSFYNFIQRPLSSNKNRPTSTDIKEGWTNFFEVIKLLQPKICLFIGTTAADELKKMQSPDFTFDQAKWVKRIGGAYAKRAVLKGKDGKETLLLFIRHTSSHFNWEQWNGFLQESMPENLNWLEEQIKQRPNNFHFFFFEINTPRTMTKLLIKVSNEELEKIKHKATGFSRLKDVEMLEEYFKA